MANSSVTTIAPLTNVALFTELAERLVNRSPDLPGFGLFYGRAGLGKTFAATYAINTFRAFYVECDYTWTQRAFCEGVMVECGLLPANTPLNMPIHRSVAMIGAYLADHPRRPLIIDEADFLIKRRMIEIVRAIYKYCADAGSSIILIGEENMAGNLKMWERVDSRVLKAVKATSLSFADVAKLAGLVCPGLKIEKALLKLIQEKTRGSARRCVTWFHDLIEFAGHNGLTEVGVADWTPAQEA